MGILFLYLLSNRRSSAINIPGITISPNPNMAKLLASKPFSKTSCGKTTADRTSSGFSAIYEENLKEYGRLAFNGRFEWFGHCDHDIGAKDPKDVIEEEASQEDAASEDIVQMQKFYAVNSKCKTKEVIGYPVLKTIKTCLNTKYHTILQDAAQLLPFSIGTRLQCQCRAPCTPNHGS